MTTPTKDDRFSALGKLEQECQQTTHGRDGVLLGTEWSNDAMGHIQCSHRYTRPNDYPGSGLCCALIDGHTGGHRTMYIGSQAEQKVWWKPCVQCDGSGLDRGVAHHMVEPVSNSGYHKGVRDVLDAIRPAVIATMKKSELHLALGEAIGNDIEGRVALEAKRLVEAQLESETEEKQCQTKAT